MELYYNGKNITSAVQIAGAVHRDTADGRCDSLELTLEQADRWYAWQPEKDDEIRMVEGKYDTGILYLSGIVPEDGKYRILATGLRSTARQKLNRLYKDTTLGGILGACAAECGMGSALYGLEGGLDYPIILRENEGCAAFLARILRMEGGVLKVFNGKLAGIGIEYAQELTPAVTLNIISTQESASYQRTEMEEYSAAVVHTPYYAAEARDTDAENENTGYYGDLPAVNAGQAGRWARGMLLWHNRQCEEVRIRCELDTALTAMGRVNITGGTDADGEWLAADVEHDFYNKRTTASLRRCRYGIR